MVADVGARIRSLRTAKGLTQAQVAEPQYTKAYISMLESGRTRASMKALEHIAGVLGVQPADLLGGAPSPATPQYTLLEARRLIEQRHADAAIPLLEGEEEGMTPQDQLFRLRYLAAAYNTTSQPKQAFPVIERAQRMADLLNDPEEQVRIKAVLAAAYARTYAYEEEVRLLRECVQACEDGTVRDVPFHYRRLVDLALALGNQRQSKQALVVYEQAFALASQFDDLPSAASLYAGIAKAYHDAGDIEAAIMNNQKSLDIYCGPSSIAGRPPPRRPATPTRRFDSRDARWRRSGSSTGRSVSRLTADLVRERVRGTILERVGDTPLIPLHRVGAGLRGDLWVKIESANPGGSVKDRPGLWMVLDAEEEGWLGRRRVVLDATSGNTGVALAMVCAVRGHPLELCMPDKVSLERKRIARAFGAQVVLTDPLAGTDGAIREAQRRAAAAPERYVYVDQYANPVNRLAHELGTAAEIWKQTGGRVTHFVAGVGTSGTIVGVSRALRPKRVRIVAVQPDDPMHGIEGWKHMPTALRPAIWDERVADVHLVMATEQALAMTKRLAREEGIFTGPSGGAAVAAAIAVAREEAGRIVVLIADGGDRYLSTPLWE